MFCGGVADDPLVELVYIHAHLDSEISVYYESTVVCEMPRKYCRSMIVKMQVCVGSGVTLCQGARGSKWSRCPVVGLF